MRGSPLETRRLCGEFPRRTMDLSGNLAGSRGLKFRPVFSLPGGCIRRLYIVRSMNYERN